MHTRFSKWTGWSGLHRVLLLVCMSLCAASAYSASKTVLVLGDSLSAEYGLARGTGWVPLLEKRLAQEKFDASVVNASISGETSSGGKARVQTLLEKHKPDLLVLELGANDALRGLNLRATESNLRDMIKAAQQRKARVILLGMQIPPNYGSEYARQFSGLFPKLARETGAELVPFFLDKVAGTPAMFQPDRIHPTAEAQPLMLDSVWPHLKTQLRK